MVVSQMSGRSSLKVLAQRENKRAILLLKGLTIPVYFACPASQSLSPVQNSFLNLRAPP